MKTIVSLLVTIAIFSTVNAYAVCTLDGRIPAVPEKESRYPYALKLHCIADGANSITDYQLQPWRGHLQLVDTAFVAGKEPTSVTPKVTTYGGVEVLSGATVTNPVTGRSRADNPEAIYDGLILSQTLVCDAGDEWYSYLVFLH